MAEIPVGTHDARVISSALGKASTGKEQLAILFEDPSGNRLTWYGYFTESAWGTTERALQALGWDPAENDYRFMDLHETALLVDRHANIVVEAEVNQETGEVRNRVRWVNKPGDGLALKERMTPEDAASFSASIRQRLIASRGMPAQPRTKTQVAQAQGRAVTAAAASRAAAPAVADAADDDIQF